MNNSINLKYSQDVLQDFDKLSEGRKRYIEKRAKKKNLSVSKYLLMKYKPHPPKTERV